MVDDADGALRCRTCGKNWLTNQATCPDDGAQLSPREPLENVHVAETMILPGRRVPRPLRGAEEANQTESTSTTDAAFDPDTAIDIDPDRGADSGTHQFDPFRSDVGTHLAHRPDSDGPVLRPPRPPGSKSSDPPTVFAHRLENHIELPPGSMVDDAYEIDHRLGAGAMGEVYAARHVKLGKRVAIKVISPRLSEDTAAVERFVQEAQTLARMHHPGLVDVLGFGELADGRAYFVMEYLSGESLFDRLQHGRLARDEALDIFGQMARALEAAHTHGVVHRDLKPENTFLARVTNEQRPIVKLLDFGLARLVVEIDRRTEHTQDGVVIGTAMYLSPEQARGPDVDGRTDIYALGCVGYELFLGRHPFQDARTAAALVAAHLHEAPPVPRSVDPSIVSEFDLMLFAMLAKDPAHRPTLPQVRSVVEGVRSAALAAALPVAGDSKAAGVRSRPLSINRRTIAIAAPVLVVGILIGAASRGPRSEAERPTITALRVVDVATPMPTARFNEGTATPAVPTDGGTASAPAAAVSPHVPSRVDAPGARAATVSAHRAVAVDATRTIAAQPAPPTRGYLRILSPQGAQILVDGTVPVGALSRLSLAPGKHSIQFSVGPYTYAFPVTIEAGETRTMDKRDLPQTRAGPDSRNETMNPFAKKASP